MLGITKRKRGRPRSENPQAFRLAIYLNEQEFREVAEIAERLNISYSEYFRALHRDLKAQK